MAEQNYLNFDLTIVPSGGGYLVETSSAGAESKLEIQWPFTEEEVADLRAIAEGPARDSKRTGQNAGGAKPDYRGKVKLFGERLFDTVFSDSILAQLEKSRMRARDDKQTGVRIRLHLDRVPTLADIPWEYMYRRDKSRFLSVWEDTPIVRYMPLGDAPPALLTPPPIRVLVMIADPEDLPRLEVDREWATIQAAFKELESSQQVTLKRLPKATLKSLRDHLQQTDYHVFHFIGHGDFEPGAVPGKDEAVLCIEDDHGKAKTISAETLSVALDHPALRLVVLNACEGAQSGTHDPFAGVAQGLVRAGIPATIAMQFRITDRAAILFADSFYNALANNVPVDGALVEARKTIFLEQNPTEWGTPVLFMRANDGRIFQFDRPSEEQIRQRRVEALSADAKAAIDNKDYEGAIRKLQEIQKLLQPVAPGS